MKLLAFLWSIHASDNAKMATPKRKSDDRQQEEDEERPSTRYLSDVTSPQVEKLKQKVVPKNTDRLGLKNVQRLKA